MAPQKVTTAQIRQLGGGKDETPKTDAEKLREQVEKMDIQDVQKNNFKNDLADAAKKGQASVLGDQRSALEKASDAALGTRSLPTPNFGTTGTRQQKLDLKPVSLKPNIGLNANK